MIHKFLRLETLAHELYRAHLPHVPAFAKKDFEGFITTEEHQRRTFEKLYCKIARVKHHPRFPCSIFLLRCFSSVLRVMGFRMICRFECEIERRAIADYTNALQIVRHGPLQKILRTILKEERSHPSLEALLQQFQHDEQEHIHVMQRDMQKKISTARR